MGGMWLLLLACACVALVSGLLPVSPRALRWPLRLRGTGRDVFAWVLAVDKPDIKPNPSPIEMDDKGVWRAKTAIKRGDVIASVPQGLTIDASRAATRLGSKLGSAMLKTGDIGVLALFILAEKASKDSKWRTYLDSLPPSAPGVLGWTEAERTELLSSTTRDVGAQLRAIEADYAHVSAVLAAGGPIPADAFSLPLFTWAMGAVKARVFFVDNKATLVPGIDSLPFDPFSTCEPFLASAGMFGGKVVKVVADAAIQPNAPIVVSFGLKSSAECLEDHGVVPLLELDDSCAELSVGIEDTDRFADDKRNILEQAGLPDRQRFDIEAAVEVDPNLIRYLRLKFIEGKDAFILEACFSDTVWNSLGLPFSRPNELRVFAYLRSECEHMLARINSCSSAESDEALLAARAAGDEGARRRLSMAELRQQERAALTGALAAVSSEVKVLEGNGLDAKEYYQDRRLRELNLLRPLDESEIVMPEDRYA